jgi:pimeloyl-ACP methyl ester carboxylesterase
MKKVLALLLVVLIFPGLAFAQTPSPPPGQFVQIDGRNVYLMCKGAGSPTIVLETGSGSSSKPIWPYLNPIASYTRVCTYDRAGFGFSDFTAQHRTVSDRADELYAVLGKGGEKAPYILVGASYGGLIVRQLAKDHPNDVAGMVLLDGVEEGSVFSAQSFAYSDKVLSELQPQLENLRKSPDSDIQAIDRLLTLIDEGQSLYIVHGEMRRPGGFGTLGNMPLAVIAHDKPFTGDAAVIEPGWRAGQERLAALSTCGRLLIATNSDHSILQHDSAMFLQALRDVYQQARSKQE